MDATSCSGRYLFLILFLFLVPVPVFRSAAFCLVFSSFPFFLFPPVLVSCPCSSLAVLNLLFPPCLAESCSLLSLLRVFVFHFWPFSESTRRRLDETSTNQRKRERENLKKHNTHRITFETQTRTTASFQFYRIPADQKLTVSPYGTYLAAIAISRNQPPARIASDARSKFAAALTPQLKTYQPPRQRPGSQLSDHSSDRPIRGSPLTSQADGDDGDKGRK